MRLSINRFTIAATILVGAVGTVVIVRYFAEKPAAQCERSPDEEVAAPSTTIQEGESITIQDGEDAVEEDLALSAEARGWTIEEARAHAVSGEVAGRLAGEIATRWPEIFIGSALSDQPYGPPTIYIKGAAPGEFLSLVAAEEVPVLIVDNQPFSFDELGERSRKVHRALLAMGFESVASGSPIAGQGMIDAAVTRKPGLPDNEDSIKAALPSNIRDSVNVTVSDCPVARVG